MLTPVQNGEEAVQALEWAISTSALGRLRVRVQSRKFS